MHSTMAKKKKGNNKKTKAGKSHDVKSVGVANEQPRDPENVATSNEEPEDLDRAPVDGTNDEIDHVEALLDRRVSDTKEEHVEDEVTDESYVQQRVDEIEKKLVENGKDTVVLEQDVDSNGVDANKGHMAKQSSPDHEELSKVGESTSAAKPAVDGDLEEVVINDELAECKEGQTLPDRDDEKSNVDDLCLSESKQVAGDLQDVVLEKEEIKHEKEQSSPDQDDEEPNVNGVNLSYVKPVGSRNVAFEINDAFSDTSRSLSEVDGDPINAHAKRKSSVEMEEVDLMRDEEEIDNTGSNNSPTSTTVSHFTTHTSKENEAFGFLIAALRVELGDDARNVSDDTLGQYLCWKPDIKRARDRFISHQKFFKDNFDQTTLLLSVNPKVCFLLRNGLVLAPEELITKDGSAVMIIRAAKCDISKHGCSDIDAGCAIFFTIQQMLEQKSHDILTGGVVIILDMVGCVRKNIPAKIVKLLSDAAGCFPIRIKAIYVVALPWWFPSGHKRLFSPKLRERIHFLKDKSALSDYIDEDRLLEEDGGIFCFDLQTWISSTLSAEVGIVSN